MKINHVGYFRGYRGHNRLYVHTDIGCLYWDQRDRSWGSKELDIELADTASLEELLIQRYHAYDMQDVLVHVRDSYYEYMMKSVGSIMEFPTKEMALDYAKKQSKKGYCITIRLNDVFETEITKYLKTKEGTIKEELV